MANHITVAIDAMGGDLGPEMTIPGANLALERHPKTQFVLAGDETVLAPVLDRFPKLKKVSRILHADIQVAMDAKPSQALRSGRRNSSMWKTIDAVKLGDADVAISAGNTGALMAMSKVILKMMAEIERPAIAAIWPTLRGESIVLDVGATIGADAAQLVDFAVMGEAMARSLFGIKTPTIGLLNIGEEEVKGIEAVKQAGAILRNSDLPIEYYGFVEGTDIGKGTVDVVVSEGFSGNIALKTAEGTAIQIAEYLRAAMKRSLFTKIGFVFARSAFNSLRAKLDPRTMNGGVFLGLNGIVVKSHGGTDELGFAHAVDLGIDMAESGLISRIARDIEKSHSQMAEFDVSRTTEERA
jgi:glycerol-3-phosphate acyltransferase PlsX